MNTDSRVRRLWWRHLATILLAPVTMALVIPGLIALFADVGIPTLNSPLRAALLTVGVLLIAGGLGLLIWTVVLFDRVGEGTLGAGELLGEPVKLVVRGPYRHVRNPMMSGVLCILLGEAAVTASGWLLVWFVVFFAFIAIGIRFWEEPHLAKRFGSEYLDYRRNVPRWIPRISAWDGPN
ncbi:isoprenylcysteine carboxylmethyltransferase family protein [Rhodococcus sp. NPDC049939]|uniref:methyltransferase family protein n=1 Tax=Rhodococcus sp. NPDC049939 TaxID=3155511 RepID=UPI0034050B9C